MARNAKSLYLASQSGWDNDPSTDGSGYLSVPAEEISEVPAGVEQIETAYQDGSVHPSPNEVGAPSLAEISFKVPLWGFGTAAGDAGSPPSVDVLDTLLSHILQTAATVDGEGVGVGSTSTNLVLDTDVYSVGNLLPYCLGSGSTSQWVYVTADAADGTYTVAPAMSPVADGAGVVYGSRYWTPPGTALVGGDLLSVVVVDDSVGTYRAANCRVSAAAITGEIGQRNMLEVTLQIDSTAVDAAKSSLPAALAVPAVTPVKTLGAPLAFNGTYYGTSKYAFDFGLTTAPVKSTASTTGRSGHEIITIAPQLTFSPLRTDALRTLQRAATSGPTIVQFGSGTLSGSTLNTLALFMGNGQMTALEGADDEGHARQDITIMGKRVTSGSLPFLRVARA